MITKVHTKQRPTQHKSPRSKVLDTEVQGPQHKGPRSSTQRSKILNTEVQGPQHIGPQREADSNERDERDRTFIFLQVDVCLYRDLEDPAAVRAQDGRGLSEQEDAVSAGLLEEYSLALVEHEFLRWR